MLGPIRKALGAVPLLLLPAAAPACAPAREAAVRLESVSIPSPSLGGSVIPNDAAQPALVLLPPSYASSPGRSYPAIYFLPGFTTDVTEYVDGTFFGFDFRRALEAFAAREPAAEPIVVIVNGRNVLGGSFYADSPVTGRWETYVVADVVPWIDAHYRTIGSRDARLLSGEGMGGFGALSLATRHPDVFGAVYAVSPEVFDENGLDDQGMLTRPAWVKAWEIDRERMSRWPRAEAPERLARLGGELQTADSRRFNLGRAFAHAYGAAFAPDPSGPPPFFLHPLRATAGGTELDPGARRLWENGYGGWEEKVALHREGLLSLRAIGMDVGRADTLAWTPRGAHRLAALLRDAGIGVEVNEHDGGHYDRLGERVERGLLPFFARSVGRGEAPPGGSR